MNSRLHFVVNPRAGRGKAIQSWKSILEQIDDISAKVGQRPFMTHSFSTEVYPYHQLSKDTVLVVVGGDGSIHHVGKIALEHELVLGIIPAGTGNDYARSLGFSESLRASLLSLLIGGTHFIDVVRANDDFIFNVGGIGMDAAVVHFIEMNPWMKRLGPLGYGVAMPTVLHRYRPYGAVVTVDGNTEEYENVSLCAIANGPSFGGGMQVVPNADLFDGVLDICLVSGLRKMGLLRLFPSIYRGKHIGSPSVQIRRGQHIRIEFHGHTPSLEFDGEPVVSAESLDVSVLHKHMRVVLPLHETD